MPTIKENLLALRAAIVAHDEKLFNLRSFRTEEACGTIYCSAGLAATMPYFTDQLTAEARKGFFLPSDEGDFLSTVSCLVTQEKMFGKHPFRRLFDSAWDGVYDAKILETQDIRTHKQLAIARIDVALAELEQV